MGLVRSASAGRVRLTATAGDGSVVPVSTLDEGSFLGLTTLRQPNLAGAYTLEEVTALHISLEQIEYLVLSKPLLMHEFGRVIDERRGEVQRLLAAMGDCGSG